MPQLLSEPEITVEHLSPLCRCPVLYPIILQTNSYFSHLILPVERVLERSLPSGFLELSKPSLIEGAIGVRFTLKKVTTVQATDFCAHYIFRASLHTICRYI